MTREDSKTCTKCGERKALGEFHRDRSRSNGRCPYCAECTRARRNAWYVENREANLAYQAKWREANKERKAEGDREWRQQNPERKRANDAAYRLANLEHRNAQIAAWRKANPERMTEIRRRRRARKHGASIAPVEFAAILQRDLGICGICEKPIMDPLIELDHVVPLAAGGTHEPENIQLAHRSCNRKKSAKTDFNLVA